MTPAEEYVKEHPHLTDALLQEKRLALALLECHRCDELIMDNDMLAELGIKYNSFTECWEYKGRIISHGY